MRAEEVICRCRKLATFSEDAQGTRRTFLSPPMRQCYAEVSAWLKAAGAEPEAKRLVVGSHLDTVPNAGAYDGVLGVVLAVALVEAFEGKRWPFGIEVVGFSEEEGIRFGIPFIGSRALVGRLDDELLKRRDAHGVSVRTAIEQFGLHPSDIPKAALKADTLAYLEFHIEQGPLLEALGRPLGVVEAIAGQTRMEFTFVGRAKHAGTTPMHLRQDALAAAAEWISWVEQIAQNTPELVATVGQIEAKPGASNVIVGRARVTLDVRHQTDQIREEAVAALVQESENIAQRRGLSIQHSVLLKQQAVAMDSFLVDQIEAAIQKTGCAPYRMTSGAGHDAMVLAEKVPTAMIFLRSPRGISHDPGESVENDDVAKAIECGLYLLNQLAVSAEFLKRTPRA
jgi:allantoate deiminase